MQNVQMIEVAKRIAAARELGDLSENAEYHAAREDQGILQARINDLKHPLARAYILDPHSQPRATAFACRPTAMHVPSAASSASVGLGAVSSPSSRLEEDPTPTPSSPEVASAS